MKRSLAETFTINPLLVQQLAKFYQTTSKSRRIREETTVHLWALFSLYVSGINRYRGRQTKTEAKRCKQRQMQIQRRELRKRQKELAYR